MSVSLCVLRIEIDEDLPEMGDNPTEAENAKEQKKKDRGARESKTITVETYASVLLGPQPDLGLLPTSSRRSPLDSTSEEDTVTFFCGNPLVEVTKGVLHLYKENDLTESSTSSARTLCLLAVPAALGARDLLAFAAACQDELAIVRVLRDGSPDHYMATLTFRTPAAAREFHSAFSGVPYTSLEPTALCHTAWVSRVEWAADGAPPPSHTELPTCPVCLERMDESVAGVLWVQCAHAFHTSCLLRWGDARCPVCRCACTPEPRRAARCHLCEHPGEEEDSGLEARELSAAAEGLLDSGESGALWICLICGHVGCGRYEGGHAAKHYMQSKHTYALQLGSNRVWDYAGDNFVHRLVQNKSDGKLVPVEEDAPPPDKQLEFTYILTSQLDTQRAHYDHNIAQLKEAHSAEVTALTSRAAAAEARADSLQLTVDKLTRENKALEKKLNTVTNKLSSLSGELNEERGLAAAMAKSQAEWQAKAKQDQDGFVQQVTELQEQLRDVMFFVEGRDRLAAAASAGELEGASVSVAPPKPRRKRR
ncbi:hypothetical protein JYU34_012315 [Plutella xylostella]|uniref:BRCA1-associated protein n=1 Tax=Plutella xylostella TaxID=51655 RepID=A0ABQ7QEV6_PLUXY|nr:hypothetical protein JYU34_012315 [Plutella xylostella]